MQLRHIIVRRPGLRLVFGLLRHCNLLSIGYGPSKNVRATTPALKVNSSARYVSRKKLREVFVVMQGRFEHETLQL